MTDQSSGDLREPGWIKLGAAAELSKHYASEGRGFLQMLATMMEGALPDETQVERRGGLFAKKTVHRVTLSLGENRYTLEDPGHGTLHASRTRVIRGIALKTEEIPVPDWLAEIGAALDERARTSEATREALEKMVW